jgi:hypothetical protein
MAIAEGFLPGKLPAPQSTPSPMANRTIEQAAVIEGMAIA